MIHEDLLVIQRLWSLLEATTQLQQERAAALKEVDRAKAALAETDDAMSTTDAELRKRSDVEKQVLQKAESYQQKVRSTRRLIDEGKASDYLLAQRQLEACTRIADELESEALQLMEAIESLERRMTDLRAARNQRSTHLQQVEHALSVSLPRLDEAIDRLKRERVDAEVAIPASYLDGVRRLQQQHRSLVSTLKDGVCSMCNFSIAPQVVLEVNRGARVHACRHCGRYLVPSD